MKKIKLASTMAVVLGVAMAGSAAATTDTGVITFQGAVNDNTCVIQGGAGTDLGVGNIIVTLDAVSKTLLASDGQKAGPKNFNIQIGDASDPAKLCNYSGNITLALLGGPTVDAQTGRLINSPGAAQNVQVELSDGKGVIDLASNYTTPVTLTSGVAQLPFSAQYVATGGAATSGRVDTSVQYQVTYN